MESATECLVSVAARLPHAAYYDSQRLLFAKVCRRKIAIQPFRVIRLRPRSVLATNPRSHSRSITAEGGRDLLKAKLLKTRRSPTCRSRSTQERSTDGCNDRPPFAAPNKMHPVATAGTRIARVTCSLARFVMAVTAEAEIRAYWGLMTLIQLSEGPERYGAFSSETIYTKGE
jgi:hypothetical protein